MKLIAHRGNIHGPSTEENSPQLIERALRLGYEVEIDVRFIDGEFWLGHDNPQYKVEASFLTDDKMWLHAKNFQALTQFRSLGVKHYFWHDRDDYTLTSSGYLWTFPGHLLGAHSIAVMPETDMEDIMTIDKTIHAICSDYVSRFMCDW